MTGSSAFMNDFRSARITRMDKIRNTIIKQQIIVTKSLLG